MTRASIHRWSFLVMCWTGSFVINTMWDGHEWAAGVLYGIGIGRAFFSDD